MDSRSPCTFCRESWIRHHLKNLGKSFDRECLDAASLDYHSRLSATRSAVTVFVNRPMEQPDVLEREEDCVTRVFLSRRFAPLRSRRGSRATCIGDVLSALNHSTPRESDRRERRLFPREGRCTQKQRRLRVKNLAQTRAFSPPPLSHMLNGSRSDFLRARDSLII